MRHRRDGLAWARRRLRFSRRQWASVLFTDECRIRLHSANGLARVRRRRSERFQDAWVLENDRWGGGSIHFWAGITQHLKTPLWLSFLYPCYQNTDCHKTIALNAMIFYRQWEYMSRVLNKWVLSFIINPNYVYEAEYRVCVFKCTQYILESIDRIYWIITNKYLGEIHRKENEWNGYHGNHVEKCHFSLFHWFGHFFSSLLRK